MADSGATRSRAKPTRARAAKITVVDDDREVRTWLEHILTMAGFVVTTVGHGVRLIGALQLERPDVLLMDVMNSWINGYELCRALKRNPQFRDIPVVFVSGRSAPQDVQRGLSAGAIEYFPKPIESRLLVARLVALMGGAR